MFEFPTKYEDTGAEGDKLWNEMMPGELFYELIFDYFY